MRSTTLFVGDENGLRDFSVEEVLSEIMVSRRRDLGLSRAELAAKVGVSSEYIRSIELGRRTPANAVRNRILEQLQYEHD